MIKPNYAAFDDKKSFNSICSYDESVSEITTVEFFC